MTSGSGRQGSVSFFYSRINGCMNCLVLILPVISTYSEDDKRERERSAGPQRSAEIHADPRRSATEANRKNLRILYSTRATKPREWRLIAGTLNRNSPSLSFHPTTMMLMIMMINQPNGSDSDKNIISFSVYLCQAGCNRADFSSFSLCEWPQNSELDAEEHS